MQKHIDVADMQGRFQTVFDDVIHRRTAYVLTDGDRPAAALIPYDEYLRWQAASEQQVLAQFDRLMERMRVLHADIDDDEVARDIEAARVEHDG